MSYGKGEDAHETGVEVYVGSTGKRSTILALKASIQS